jgi:hypothetical protein
MMYGLQGHLTKMSLVQKSSKTSVEQSFLRGVPEDGAAYGVDAALTQSFNMCLSIEDFQFWHILGFPLGSSGHAPKMSHEEG